MINIFIEGYDLTAEYLQRELLKFIKPDSHVAVVAFSFRESQVASQEDWDALYSKENGRYYGRIVNPLLAYGVDEGNVTFVDYYRDSRESAAEKVRNADVVYFLGGLMDKSVERIDEFELRQIIAEYDGVFMGYSAGALIQLREYHVSPDDDYPEFGYYDGLALLDGFYLEVHYEGNPVQQACIQRVLNERRRPVYATKDGDAAIIIDNGEMTLLGHVTKFEPEVNA